MSDQRCEDHQAQAIDTCGICQRPLCKRCVREGPLPRCARCVAEDAKLPGAPARIGPPIVVIMLMLLGLLIWFCSNCGGWVSRSIHT